MCGICGIVYCAADRSVDQAQLTRMRDAMTHRGPDDAGNYLAPGIGLGSRRLSIIDLSARGHMPMNSADGRYWITFNGEIYNFKELRAELESRGYRFRSATDTEVVLNLYAEHGPAMLEKLNGIFAIAIWDSQARTLLLARDHVGVKPLYYTQQTDGLYFASEAKALLAAGLPAQFNHQAWEELLCFRFVAGEQTVFDNFRRLLPGHYLLWQAGQTTIRPWWRLSERLQARRAAQPAEVVRWYRETFDDAVNRQRISDVSVGVLLSGGLDSSCVAASLAQQGGEGTATFTVRFAEKEYDEGPYAKLVAERYGLQYHELTLSGEEVTKRLFRASWLNDEPFAHQNDLHMWAISEYAKPRVTVLLSGEGGDETLCGYVRYQPLRYPAGLGLARPVLAPLARLGLGGRVGKLGRFLAFNSLEQIVLFNACNILPVDLQALGLQPTFSYPYRQQVLAEATALFPYEPVRQAMYLDLFSFLTSILDRNDRMTMGASIECRVPFLDHRLLEGLAALPSRRLLRNYQSKALLRSAMNDRLPGQVQRHRKWGFSVPWETYLRQVPRLRQMVVDLPSLEPLASSPLDRGRLTHVVQTFLAGQPQYDLLVRQLFMIAAWHQAIFNGVRE